MAHLIFMHKTGVCILSQVINELHLFMNNNHDLYLALTVLWPCIDLSSFKNVGVECNLGIFAEWSNINVLACWG